MALVRLSDAVIPAVYLSYGIQNRIEKLAIWQSGAIFTNPLFETFLAQGGQEMTVPYWGDIDPTVEPNYSTDNPADIAVPLKIGSGFWRARKSFLNQGWSDADLVKELAGSDPMVRIRDRTSVYWQRQWQRRLIATLLGIYNANVAQNGGDMRVDTTGLTADAQLMSLSAFIDARSTFGDYMDEQGIRGAAIMHSAVYAYLLKKEEIEFIPDSETKAMIATYNGYRIVVDDSTPRTAAGGDYNYTIILLGPNSIGYAEAFPDVPVAVDRKEEQGNGGGVEILWERRNWMLHPAGYHWTETTVTGQSPTLANLQLAANWNRVEQRKAVPIAFLRTRIKVSA